MNKRYLRLRHSAEAGLAVAEYAVAMIAVCAFAALLYRILTGNVVEKLLVDVVKKAISFLF